MNEADEGARYKVVVNHEEQYSLWPADRGSPLGWRDAGKAGSRVECLAYVKDVWTDMRPLSLRRQMDAAGQLPRESDFKAASRLSATGG